MKQLPEGFVIRQQPTAMSMASLPAGFVIRDMQPTIKPTDSTEDDIARAIAIPVRGLATGAAGIMDLPFIASNKIQEGFASAIDAITGNNVVEKTREVNAETKLPSQSVGELIDSFNQGRATPRNSFERGVQKTAEFLGSSASMANTGLATTTGKELLGLGGAGAASQIAEDQFPNNEIAQAIAPIVGGVATSAAISAPGAMSRGVQRSLLGTEQQAVTDLARAGVSPTVAATGGKGSKLVEQALSSIPGSAGVIEKASKQSLDEIYKSVEDVASTRGVARTTQRAGKALQSGAQGFIDRFQTKADELYNKLDTYIPKESKIKVSNTQGYLNEVKGRFDDLPQLSSIFNEPIVNNSIRAFDDVAKPKLSTDYIMGATTTVDDTLKYNTVRNLRSVIGRKLNSASLDGDTRASLNQMYGALSKDMEQAAMSKGDKALNAFKRANNYYKAGSDRIENVINKVVNSDTPAKAYNYVIQGTKDGSVELARLKKSLKPDEFGELQSAVIRKLGQAKAGGQNAEGNAFSVNTYLTNWNNISSEAKKVMFGGKDTGFTKKMDYLAKAAERLKDVEKLANTSGTARVDITARTLAGLALAPYTTTSLLAGGYITAKMMTSPKYVNWLTEATRMKTKDQLAGHITKLSAVAAASPSARDDIANFIESLRGEDK